MSVRILQGDCREVLAAWDGDLFDSACMDPPYHLTSIVKRFGAENAAPAKTPEGGTGAYARASKGFMGKQWDGGDVAFQPETWRAVYDVLKPGAFLVAFGGTRTYHRMACAIEDAGFEVRDQLGWMYASGFPKSHNVGKAIDKAAGAEREVVGEKRAGLARKARAGGDMVGCDSYEELRRADITAPATDAARQWEGWGTALKPAWEPIVLARKPLGILATNVVEVVEFHLRQMGVDGEIRWKSDSVSVAARISSRTSSSLIGAQQAAVTYVENAAASETPNNVNLDPKCSVAVGISGQPQTLAAPDNIPDPRIESCETKSSPLMASDAPVAAKPKNVFSPSTTLTGVEPPTENPSAARSTPNSAVRVSRPATEYFAGIATGLSDSLAHVLIVRDSDGYFIWPTGLPKQVEAQRLTVAANVLAHGTGALNIDGCRVETDEDRRRNARGGENGIVGSSTFKIRERRVSDQAETPGRWPANILHDGSEEVLAVFPDAPGQQRSVGPEHGAKPSVNVYGDYGPRDTTHPRGDSGSAARFFYCAKADAGDRLGSKHPTVKPVDLMAYLVRLITPPGGTVLDCFAGTGTTGMACMREGFNAVLIEREDEYIADIKRRIGHVSGVGTPLFEASNA